MSYELKKKEHRFRVTGRYGIARAERLVREAKRNFKETRKRDGSGGSR